jgi:hypothetical protein
MKKYIYCLFIISISFSVVAQKSVGLSIGAINSSYVFKGDFDENFDNEQDWSKIGYQGSLFYNQPLGQGNFSFVPNLSFSKRENKFSQENRDNAYAYWSETTYSIGLDVLFRYKFPSKFISPYLETGPSWGFNNSGVARRNIKANGQDKDERGSTKSNIQFGKSSNDTYKSTVFGWTFGAGLNAEFDFGTVGLGLRYFTSGSIVNRDLDQYGLVTIDDNNQIRLRNLTLNISYILPLGGY